jgi:hypothetical protein
MTESMISRLERGDHVPSLRTLCRIADAFGRRLEISFPEHEHEHADGRTHSASAQPFGSGPSARSWGRTMTVGPELLLIGAVAAVGVLHTIVPDHWVPITVMAPGSAEPSAARRKPAAVGSRVPTRGRPICAARPIRSIIPMIWRWRRASGSTPPC